MLERCFVPGSRSVPRFPRRPRANWNVSPVTAFCPRRATDSRCGEADAAGPRVTILSRRNFLGAINDAIHATTTISIVPGSLKAILNEQPGPGRKPNLIVSVDGEVEVDWDVKLVAATP
jgi:hypothetical protein